MSDLIQKFKSIVNEVTQRLNDVDKEGQDLKLVADKLEKSMQPKVKLNVGGMKFVTTVQTLKSHKGSFFDLLLSGRWNVEETIFIDRDGSMFKYILDLLRGELDISTLSPFDLRRLQKEADFFQLTTVLSPPSSLCIFSPTLKSPFITINENEASITSKCHADVLGTEEYREGVHIFKLSILNPQDWLFIGIGNEPLKDNSHTFQESSYGWAGCNSYEGGSFHLKSHPTRITSGDVVTLQLDCNNNFLLFKNDTKKSYPNVLSLPPGKTWRLHLNMYYQGCRVKLVDKIVLM